MMNPEMMKAAQDMMSKMSPDDMQKMMAMQQEMCVWSPARHRCNRRTRARHTPSVCMP